ncbi:MAG: glycerophosphodiester phosphodiesterase family protein [Parvularculaceae bacterium]
MRHRLIFPTLVFLSPLALCACGADPAPAIPADKSSQIQSLAIKPSAGISEFFDCVDAAGVPLISAHRGGSPENALSGMAATLTKIAAIPEIDVASLADGTLVLMHDDTVERTTNGTGTVADMSLANFQALELDDTDGEAPPLFSDVLAWAKGKTILQLDLKPSTDYDDVIAMVRQHQAQDRVIFITYTIGQAKLLHRKMPEAMLSVTIDRQQRLQAFLATDIPPSNILAWTGTSQPNPKLYKTLDNKGIEVIFGTLGGSRAIDKQIKSSGNYSQYADIIHQGADIIATDFPQDVAKALQDSGLTLHAPKCGLGQ